MFRMIIPLRSVTFVGGLSLLVWGCGSDTAGPTDPDPTGCEECAFLAESGQQMVADFVTSNTALSSSLALADAMTVITSQNGEDDSNSIQRPVAPLQESRRAAAHAPEIGWTKELAFGRRAVAPGAVRTRTRGTAPVETSSIPSEHQGATFTWDLETDGYVEDPGAPALAPPEGIRFRIYDIAPGGFPAEPLDDIGFTDLEDDSFVTPSEDLQFMVTAVSEGAAASGFAFQFDGLVTDTEWDLTEDGSLSHQTGSLGYTFGMHATFGQVSINSLDLDIAYQGSGVQGTLIADFGPNAAGSQTVTFQSGQDDVVIHLVFNTSGALQTGSLATVNGQETATISGQLSSFSLSGVQSPDALWEPAAGSGASGAEVTALQSLLLELEAFMLVLEDLFWFGFDVQSGPVD